MNICRKTGRKAYARKIKIRASKVMQTGILLLDQVVGERVGPVRVNHGLIFIKNENPAGRLASPAEKSQISTTRLLKTEIAPHDEILG